MIKLFSLKQQKKEGEGAKSGIKRASAAQLRIQKGKAIVQYPTFLMFCVICTSFSWFNAKNCMYTFQYILS